MALLPYDTISERLYETIDDEEAQRYNRPAEITRAVFTGVNSTDLAIAMHRHVFEHAGEGTLCGRDPREWTLRNSRGELSSHFDRNDVEFWILTHSLTWRTTICLPEEY